MTVVVDTNVLPGMFTTGHSYRPITLEWLAGRFVWALSADILLEYEEVLNLMKGPAMTRRILGLIESVGAARANLVHVSPSFFFRTIAADRDDDKFADCAIAAHADYIITSDKHFAPLIGSGFKPQPITPEDFINQFLTNP